MKNTTDAFEPSTHWHTGRGVGAVEAFGWSLEHALRYAEWADHKGKPDAAKGLRHYARRVRSEGQRRYGAAFDDEIQRRKIDTSSIPPRRVEDDDEAK